MAHCRTHRFARGLALVTTLVLATCSGPGDGTGSGDTAAADAASGGDTGGERATGSGSPEDTRTGGGDTGERTTRDGETGTTSCEKLCNRVYDECGLFLLYYTADKVPKSGCVDACNWGYFVGKRDCIIQGQCSEKSLNSCIKVEPASPDLETLDPENDWPDSWKKFDRQVFALVNLHRKRGVTCGDTTYEPTDPLEWDENVAEAARAHSLDMAKNGFYGHQGSDGSLPGARIARTDYGSPRASGEAINRTFSTPFAAVKSWLESTSHCRRMVSPKHPYVDVGSGYVHAPDHQHTHLWTLDYAAP